MSNEELINSILEEPSENRTLEFKRMGDSKSSVVAGTLESVVAMSNTDGGTIVLGVDDPEKTRLKGSERIFGIEENLTLFDELGQKIKFIRPPLSEVWPPLLIEIPTRKVRIAIINVPKATENFHEIEGAVLVRQEKGNKRLSPHEVHSFAYTKGFKKADSELVDVSFSLLDTEAYHEWKDERAIKQAQDVAHVLVSVGLAREDVVGNTLPTRAAVMLFAEHPTMLMDTKCAVRVFQYDSDKKYFKGDTYNYVGIPKTIDAPAKRLIKSAQDYVLSLLRSGVKVESGFVTTYKIPERAIKEAITNAVIHRDYNAKRDIEVHIFEDRVEIESPGLLPFNITPSNIGHVRATGYRNDLLVKHLREFPDPPNVDQNEGVRKMRDAMSDEKLYPPIFITYPLLDDAVRLVLLNEKAPSGWEKIEHYLGKNKYINNGVARKLLNKEDTSVVSRMLSSWTKRGLLTKITPRSGSKQKVVYRLPTEGDRVHLQNDRSNEIKS